MTNRLTEDDIVARVTRLTRVQLIRFVESEFVRPQQEKDGYVFRHVDIARLELLCDLSLDLGLDDTALDVVVSLIDQLHAARQDLAVLARALDTLPPDLRQRVADALKSPQQDLGL